MDRESPEQILAAVTNIGNKLNFESEGHFKKVYDVLTERIDAHNQSFVTSNPTLSETALSDLSVAQNFDPNAPLAAFELSKNFSSQRVASDAIIKSWLASSNPNSSNFPIIDRTIDPVMGSMLNINGEFLINGKDGKLETYDYPEGPLDSLCVPVGMSNIFKDFDEGTKAELVQTSLGYLGFASTISTTASNWRKVGWEWAPAWRSMSCTVSKNPNFTINCGFRFSDGGAQNFRTRFTRTITEWQFLTNGGLSNNKLNLIDQTGGVDLGGFPTIVFATFF